MNPGSSFINENEKSGMKRNTILRSDQKIALLEKYMENDPSPAQIISFLSLVDDFAAQNHREDIMHTYNMLSQEVREKLMKQPFLDVVSWLRDFNEAKPAEREELINKIPAARNMDIDIEILSRDLRSNNLIIRIKDDVYITYLGNIYYTYDGFNKCMTMDDIELEYLKSYEDWLKDQYRLN